jgi:hypothetical protein
LLVLLVPGLALAQPGHRAKETTQQGSGARGRATSAPGPGIEAGAGNAMAGGRTDFGPTGQTGIDGAGVAHERALARANDQARGENEKGSFLRPADSPPDINLDARAIGSGADYGAFPTGAAYYFDEHHQRHGQAGGISSGTGNQAGGSASQGSAGKSHD